MSFNDIKNGYTEIKIDGVIYKISYDFNAISELEKEFNSSFFSLIPIVDDLKSKNLKDILKFCHVGFLKYQPDFRIEALENYLYFGSLYTVCMTEFVRCVRVPDEYEEMIDDGKKSENVKKKFRSILDIIFFKR